VNDKTKLKRMELAIKNYNAMIRALKKQATTNSVATRKAIVQYQQWRDEFDVQLGLERIAQGRPA
jgi:hypothetical protein